MEVLGEVMVDSSLYSSPVGEFRQTGVQLRVDSTWKMILAHENKPHEFEPLVIWCKLGFSRETCFCSL